MAKKRPAEAVPSPTPKAAPRKSSTPPAQRPTVAGAKRAAGKKPAEAASAPTPAPPPAAASSGKPPLKARKRTPPAQPVEVISPAAEVPAANDVAQALPKPVQARVPRRAPGKSPVKTAKKAPAAPATSTIPLDIVMVASEMHPFATSGGLAEVVAALSGTLTRLGHAVTVIVPRYRRVLDSPAMAADPGLEATASFDMGRREQSVSFYRHALSDRQSVVFVDAPELFDRDGLYGDGDDDYPDNAFRFAVFSRAALEYVRLRGVRPSVIHVHDWQTGLLPAYQKMLFSPDPVVGGVPVVFTIHNLAFQGNFPAVTLNAIELPWDVLHVEGMEFHGGISYLKAGINFSERLTTVSPTYAQEVLTPAMGFGFDGVLRRRADDLVGILNGIDTERWNPAADPFVAASYNADDLSGKREAKRLLLQASGLDASENSRRPVIGLVSRLTDQKGFDLIAAALDELMSFDAAWVMLGSGERKYEQLWRALAERFPERVSTTIGYGERLEHLIEAGSDAFLMASRFEPCGLNQLNSLRYGTLPIVRATGGLNDTVRDASLPGGTGFTFEDYSAAALVGAVRRALDAFQKPDVWQALQRSAMAKDYSWDVSAREYVKVYSANS